MLAMLLFVIAGTTNFVHANPLDKGDSLVIYVKKSFDNIQPVTEPDKFTKADQEMKIKKTNVSLRKLLKQVQLLMEAESNNNTPSVNRKIREETIDLVDRSDYVSQFLADLFVNTDEENTIIEATEPVDPVNNPHDLEFYRFLLRRECYTRWNIMLIRYCEDYTTLIELIKTMFGFNMTE